VNRNYGAEAERSPRSASRTRLLRDLGARVRARRTALGLTMRALAKRAGVSERFLAQLEAGEGNISVLRLEDVAEALGTSGAELLAPALSSPRTERPVVALVGLRGAGKSAVGRELAKRLGAKLVELDEEIAREAQMTLSSIFEIHGERYYRAIEREVLRRLLERGERGERMVIATGGSLVTDPETWGLLRSRAQTVWLKATPEEHWDRVVAQGDVRPMRGRPRARNELKQLLAARTPLYRQAELTIDTSSRSLEAVVADLLRRAEG
jgi:XRE family transcriptional regulator, aerobic/anaerobic benzoate catabolism transcriptional regulator